MFRAYHLFDALVFHIAQMIECQLSCLQIQSVIPYRASKVSVVVQKKRCI